MSALREIVNRYEGVCRIDGVDEASLISRARAELAERDRGVDVRRLLREFANGAWNKDDYQAMEFALAKQGVRVLDGKENSDGK